MRVAFFISNSNKCPPNSALFPQSFTLIIALIFIAAIRYTSITIDAVSTNHFNNAYHTIEQNDFTALSMPLETLFILMWMV